MNRGFLIKGIYLTIPKYTQHPTKQKTLLIAGLLLKSVVIYDNNY